MNEQYKAAAENAAARVAAVRRADSLVFPLFTDLHTHTLEERSVTELLAMMDALSAVLKADGVLALGDNPAMLGREVHASNADIHALLQGLLDRVAARWDCPLYAVNGNHDGIGTDFYDPEFWYAVTGGRYDRGTAVREGHSGYYYVDLPGGQMRLVVLSLPSGSRLKESDPPAVSPAPIAHGDEALPTPLWEYGAAQLRWLAETALKTDRAVLIAAHVPFYGDYRGDAERKLAVFDGEKGTETYISVLCGWIGDRAVAEDIFHAFQKHEAYENAAYGIRMEPSAESAVLAGFLSGHTHSDSLWLPGETKKRADVPDDKGRTNTLPCVQIVTGAAAVGINPALRGIAAYPVTMDIAVVTPSERRITMVRLGDGEDREARW